MCTIRINSLGIKDENLGFSSYFCSKFFFLFVLLFLFLRIYLSFILLSLSHSFSVPLSDSQEQHSVLESENLPLAEFKQNTYFIRNCFRNHVQFTFLHSFTFSRSWFSFFLLRLYIFHSIGHPIFSQSQALGNVVFMTRLNQRYVS